MLKLPDSKNNILIYSSCELTIDIKRLDWVSWSSWVIFHFCETLRLRWRANFDHIPTFADSYLGLFALVS